jgi:hypothetical protein
LCIDLKKKWNTMNHQDKIALEQTEKKINLDEILMSQDT